MRRGLVNIGVRAVPHCGSTISRSAGRRVRRLPTQPTVWLLKPYPHRLKYECTLCPGGWLARWLIVGRAIAADPLSFFEL
jgi:hypothetical protein